MGEKRASKLFSWISNPTFWFIILLLLVIFLRLHRFNSVPPGIHFDEIINGEIAQMARQEGFRIFYTEGWGREGLYHIFLASSFSLPLPVNWQMRLPSVVLSIVGLALTYAWVRKSFGAWAAITATAGLGISFWSLNLSRVALRAVLVLPLSAGVIWLLLDLSSDDEAAPSRSRSKALVRQSMKIVLLALLMGALSYTYRAARVLPAVYLLFLLYLIIWHRPLKRGLLLAYLGALLISIPLILFLENNTGAELRIGQVDHPWQELLAGNPQPIVSSALATLGMFGWKGDLTQHYNLAGRPVFEPVGFVLFLVGTAISAYRWRKPTYALILIWFVVGLLPGMVTEPAPHFIHTIVAIPIVFVFPGITVAAVKDWAVSKFGEKARIALGIVLALWIIGSTIWTYRDYFLIWPQQAEVRSFQQSDLANLARYLDASGEPLPTFICTEFLNEQDPFWRSGRQSMPFLLDRKDLDIRWYDCRSSSVVPAGEGAATYLYLGQTTYADRLVESAEVSPYLGDTFRGDGFIAETKNTDPANRSLLESLDFPADASGKVIFGDQVEFLGYDISDSSVKPGDSIDLYTYWRVLSPLPSEMAVFVHLMAEDGMMTAQGDALSLLSDTLQVGDIFVQKHQIAIPGEAPAGLHTLSTGIYSRFGEFPPLLVIPLDGSDSPADRIVLEQIEITP